MRHIWLLATALAAHSASGADFKIDCPAEIGAASVRIVNPPANWRAAATAPIYLHNAAPLDGPPEDLGTLMGGRSNRRRTNGSHAIRYPAISRKVNGSRATMACSTRYRSASACRTIRGNALSPGAKADSPGKTHSTSYAGTRITCSSPRRPAMAGFRFPVRYLICRYRTG